MIHILINIWTVFNSLFFHTNIIITVLRELDELEREDFTRLKLVKKIKEKEANEAAKEKAAAKAAAAASEGSDTRSAADARSAAAASADILGTDEDADVVFK